MASSETESIWLVDLPPTARQSWAAVAVAAILLAGFGAVSPFAGRPLPELNALFPSLDGIVFVTDLITSVLLFAQFSIFRSRALLLLAAGYFFTALIVIPHALTFTGAFSPTGLLGATIQTGSWLFIFWHAGFALALLAYAVLTKEKTTPLIGQAPTSSPIAASVAGVCVLVCALTWLATGGSTLLPPVILDNARISPSVTYYIGVTILISAAALALLATRRRSVLHQWLMVVTLASILELVFSGLIPAVRFSLGFYAGRVFSLTTSSIVLIVLLAETTRLYVLLARSNLLLLREKNNKLMNLEAMAASISHELRQPLTGVTLNGAAVQRFLNLEPPMLAQAKSAAASMVGAGERIGEVLSAMRTLFGRTKWTPAPVDINDMVLAALRTLDAEAKNHRVTTRVEIGSGLPPVMGHRGQLEEVMINLIHNAIEAMDFADDDRRVLQVRTRRKDGRAVTIVVEDSGPGIDPKKSSAIFDAFFTTKPHGMGLGLAICRMIIERHDGDLSVSAAEPRGAIFVVTLPQGPAT